MQHWVTCDVNQILHIFSSELNGIEFQLHRITSNVHLFIIHYEQRQRNFHFEFTLRNIF